MQIKLETQIKNNIINFYPAAAIKIDGLRCIDGSSAAAATDLDGNLAALDGVERVLIAPDFISISHAAAAAVEELKMLVMSEIDDYFAAPYALAGNLSAQTEVQCAEALADALIRPTLNRDNGDIVIHGIKDGVMELSFTGHCAGCPYAANTLQNVIMRTFLRYMPQIKEIRQTEAK